jgi:magnesium-transporting ATPase (P-type)
VDRRGASRVIGYLSWRGDRVPSALSAPLLGASTDLAGFLARHPVSEVYLAARSEQHGDELASAARTCDAFGVRLAVPMLPFRLTRGRARRRPLVIALIVVANAVLGYLQVFEGNRGLDNARTAGFTTLVLTQPFNCCKAGSKTTSALRDGFVNPRLWGAVVLGAVLQIAVVHVGLLDAAFGTVPLTPDQSLVCTGMASLVLWVSEVRKLIGRALAGRG